MIDCALAHVLDVRAGAADPATAVSDAAHDLNNLCATILGFAALMRQSLGASSPLHPYMTEIVDAAQRARCVAADLHRISGTLQHPSAPPRS